MAKSKTNVTLKIARLAHSKGIALPEYQSEEAAGLDLVAAVPKSNPVKLAAGARALIPTGLCFELPKGFEAQVRPRSGLALKHGITVLNTPGTIDSDYRGEVQVILINLGSAPFVVRRGERIAQLIVAPVTQVSIKASNKLSKSERGAGGFGSTGRSKKAQKTKSASKRKSKAKAKLTTRTKKKSKSSSKANPKRPTRKTTRATTPKARAKARTAKK